MEIGTLIKKTGERAMNLCNWILTKLALVLVLVSLAAAIDVPNNPVRHLFRTFCQSVNRHSADGPPHAR